MINEQKTVLDFIRLQIELAKEHDNGKKTAEMHMQFLINAPTLEHLDFNKIISYVGLNECYRTELSKMIKLYNQLKLNNISLIKTL